MKTTAKIPSTQKALDTFLEKGGIVKFAHCGRFYEGRYNASTEKYEQRGEVMSGRFQGTGEKKQWEEVGRFDADYLDIKEAWTEEGSSEKDPS